MTTSQTTAPAPRDPRITSPEIKVTYPAENKTATPTSTRPISTAVPLSKIQAVQSLEPKATKVETPAQQPTTPPQNVKIPLSEAVKQHLWVFIGCGVALLAIGFLIGKKQVS